MRRSLLVPALVLTAVIVLGAGFGYGVALRGETGEASAEAPPAVQHANGPIAMPGRFAVALAGTRDRIVVPFEKPPRAGLLFDLETGEVLWRRNPEQRLPIASVTKMMTALLVADMIPDGEKVPVTKEALAYTGSGVGVLPKGRWVGVSAMLHGLMLVSGNDAAIALAQRASGSVAGFVRQMNLRAQAMGLPCTRFASPSGIIDKGNHSCAADLAVLAHALLDQPRVAKIVKRRSAVLPFPIDGGKLHLSNNNPLHRAGYEGTLGIKTGYTDAAGRCIVSAAERDGRRYGVVLLDSPDPGKQAMQLLDRAFALV